MLHLYPTRTAGARNVVRHRIPELLLECPSNLMEKVRTHSISPFILMSSIIWLVHIPLSASRWSVIYVSVTRHNYGMLVICMIQVFLEFSILWILNPPFPYRNGTRILFSPSLQIAMISKPMFMWSILPATLSSQAGPYASGQAWP